MSGKILLIDDDPKLLRLVEYELGEAGFETVTAETGHEALDRVREQTPAAVVLDLMLPDISGKELLDWFRREHPRVPVVVLTAQDQVEDAVECMRLGAADFVQKPFERARLVTSVRNACHQRRLEQRVQALATELRKDEGFDAILGHSTALRDAVSLLGRAAGNNVTVLLTGESGTGKEVAARAIHAESDRRTAPFVAVNCGAIPEGLIESELFGHEKGAFTGATSRREGCFEQADGGTLFLDEIGELRTDLQVRLLRVLQERCVVRVGSSQTHPVDVRVLAATNRDLKAESTTGAFREDLYYRLAVFPVKLPALRERDGDVKLLAEHFVRNFAARYRRDVRGISDDVVRMLESYGWPGNVRELENVLERAVILEDSMTIGIASIPEELVRAASAAVGASVPVSAPGTHASVLPDSVPRSADEIAPFHEEERRIIQRALELTGWNVQETAQRLELGRNTVYRKIERYGLRRAREPIGG
jgi:DNA-binding NtrC family response regulator